MARMNNTNRCRSKKVALEIFLMNILTWTTAREPQYNFPTTSRRWSHEYTDTYHTAGYRT